MIDNGMILGQMAGASQTFYPGYNQSMMNPSLGETATTNAVLTGQHMAGGTTCHNNTTVFSQRYAHLQLIVHPPVWALSQFQI